uniref:Uncharacterized protein n=1 Tax=Romanomermis culicivorax TaxID=13658 RepID=A0A915KNA5_ROMCU
MPYVVGQDLKTNEQSSADNGHAPRNSPSTLQVVRPAPLRPPYASNALVKRFPELFLPEQLLINTLGGRQRFSAFNYHHQAQFYGYGQMGSNLQTTQSQQDENSGNAITLSQEPLLRRLSARTPRDNGVVTNFRRFSAIKSFKERSTTRSAMVNNYNNNTEIKVNDQKPLLTIDGSMDRENFISEEENSSLATISLPRFHSEGVIDEEHSGKETGELIVKIEGDQAEKAPIAAKIENFKESSKEHSQLSSLSKHSSGSDFGQKTPDGDFPLPPPEMIVEPASSIEFRRGKEHLLITYQANLLNMATEFVSSRVTNLSTTEPIRKLSRVNDRLVIDGSVIEEIPEESSHNFPTVVSTIAEHQSASKTSDSNNNGDDVATVNDKNDDDDGDDDDFREMSETHPMTSSIDEDEEEEDEESSLSENKLCTSFRIKIPYVRNPVDMCVLPDDYFAIADYSNGLVIIGPQGTLIGHKNSIRDVNACGVGALRLRSSDEKCTLLVLVCQNSTQWKINFYEGFQLTQAVDCPEDGQIESWALRRIVVAAENTLYLLASGEYKSCIWTLNLYNNSWAVCFSQYKKWCGIFSDLSIRCCRLLQNSTRAKKFKNKSVNNKENHQNVGKKSSKNCSSIFESISTAADTENKFVRFLLCDWRKARLKNFVLNHKGDEIYTDVGRGEVSSLIVKDDWLYVLCRQKLCIEAYLYRDDDT